MTCRETKIYRLPLPHYPPATWEHAPGSAARGSWQRGIAHFQRKAGETWQGSSLTVQDRAWESSFAKAAFTLLQPPHLLLSIYSCKQSFIGLRWFVLNPVFKRRGISQQMLACALWGADAFLSAVAPYAPPAASTAPLIPCLTPTIPITLARPSQGPENPLLNFLPVGYHFLNWSIL